MESLIALSSVATVANFFRELLPEQTFTEPINNQARTQMPAFTRPKVRFDWKAPVNFQSHQTRTGQEWFGNSMRLY